MPRTPYWIDTVVGVQATAGAGGVVLDLDNMATQSESRGTTLIRCLAHLFVASSVEGGVTGQAIAHLGIGVASREAFALGISGVPDPATESERPPRGWIWRDAAMVREISGSVTGAFVDLKVDVRSMRKVDDGRLFLRIEPIVLSGTGFVVQIAGLVRCLCKLP